MIFIQTDVCNKKDTPANLYWKEYHNTKTKLDLYFYTPRKFLFLKYLQMFIFHQRKVKGKLGTIENFHNCNLFLFIYYIWAKSIIVNYGKES